MTFWKLGKQERVPGGDGMTGLLPTLTRVLGTGGKKRIRIFGISLRVTTFDMLVKSQKAPIFVIPAKAGFQ